MATASTAASTSLLPPSPSPPRLAGLERRWCWGVPAHSPGRRAFHANRRRRKKRPEKSLLCAADKGPEKSFEKTIEVDRLFDMLRNANPTQKDNEELAENVVNIVDRLVHKTDEKIEQSTDVLKAIITPVMREGEEVKWSPRDQEALKLMEKEISNREKEGQLDEGFLAEVNAQLRLKKMVISQGFKLCCKRCCSYICFEVSPKA